jgi:hypothetical protein
VIITRKPKGLASADREQDFLPEGILELLELQRRFTFIAEHFKYRRAAFFGHLDTAVFKVHDVHLQRLDLKVPVIAAIWTSQRQNQFPLPPLQAAAQSLILCAGWLAAQREIGRKSRICAKFTVILLP